MSDSYETAIATNSAALVLSKTAWTVGLTLSKLARETTCTELCLISLVDDVKVLGNECDRIYVESSELLKHKRSNSNHRIDVDENVWSCLAQQIGELEKLMRQLEKLIGDIDRNNRDLVGQLWEASKAEKYRDHLAYIRTYICKYTVDLHTTLSLMKT